MGSNFPAIIALYYFQFIHIYCVVLSVGATNVYLNYVDMSGVSLRPGVFVVVRWKNS